ncbi:hypothetical protein FIBSPDRAFT_902013 [Athelia psychrophila]|uniref:F-box domain-containing protein n=1 Tax=Athelia psychrophila TaxID=1759441 RepID=A0A167XRG9_9AGAM|nr:hypothetical protein FIBSPDRAFT_902013 [Fibularhizoctonia sp. CBS 109695]
MGLLGKSRLGKMQRMAIFPVEVSDLIIDQVPVLRTWSGVIPPNRQLASCAMVCRSWARHSRSRHFKSLDFSVYAPGIGLSRFLDLISSPHATIAPHVRRISFIFSGGKYSMTRPLLMRLASLRALESISLRDYRMVMGLLQYPSPLDPQTLFYAQPESLSIGLGVVIRNQAVLGRLLRTLGPTLEELSIQGFPIWPDTEVISYEHIDLRYNTRLEVLSFRDCHWSIIQRHILALAYQVSSIHLRELNISIPHLSTHKLNVMLKGGPEGLSELAGIDTLLQRSNFANLEGFNIGLRSTMDLMQEIFPHTAARNILRVMDGSEMWNK